MEWKYECLPHQNLNELKYISKKETYKIYKFNDILIDETRKAKKIKKSDYLDEGSTPIFDQSKEFIAGYTNIEDGIYSRTPFILFGDHTRVFKYIKINGCLGADGAKIINLKEKYIDEINLKYIYYYFNHIIIPDTGYNRHFKYVKGLLIPVPSLSIQEQIVDVLDRAQELIDKRKAQLEGMDSLIESIFYTMFGDPVRNEKGWEVKELGDVVEINMGQSPPSKTYNNIGEGLPFFQGNKDFGYRYPTVTTYCTEPKKISYKGDILMSVRAPIGDLNISIEKCCIGRGLCALTVNDIGKEYLFNVLKFKKEVLQLLGTGSTFKAINKGNLGILEIPTPPLDLQNEFAQKVELIEREKEVLEESLELMEENYRSIMDRAFKGELFN